MVMLLLIGCSIALVAYLGYRQWERTNFSTIWVANALLSPGHVLNAGDLIQKRVRTQSAQTGAITEPRKIIGNKLASEKKEGEGFYPSDFSRPKTSRTYLTDQVPEGRVLYTLVPDQAILPYGDQLHQGDRFDILVTMPGGQVTPLAFDVIMLGMLRGPKSEQKQTSEEAPDELALSRRLLMSFADDRNKDKGPTDMMVLALHPEHVYPLASSQGSPGRLSFVVHGQRDLKGGNRLNVVPDRRPPTSRTVEVYEGLNKSHARVRL